MARREDSRPLAERFGLNVRRARQRAGLSQAELGVRADLHLTHLGAIQRGARLPRLDTIIKLAGSIEVDPRELLDGLSWSPAEVGDGRFYVAGEPRHSLTHPGEQGGTRSAE
jgi:transcriptional regulator with XRE-family HTH domain